MQVFKLFFRIIYKNKWSVIVTLLIAFAMSFMFVQDSASSSIETKAKVVIADQDQSEASKALTTYLKDKVELQDVKEADIEDAMYYRQVDYVLYIPKGYEASLDSQAVIELEKKQLPDSSSAYVVDSYVTNYTDTLYAHATYGNSDIKDVIKATNEDMKEEIAYTGVQQKDDLPINFLFNFLNYSFFSGLIAAIGIVMIELNKTDIKRRLMISPISNKSYNFQIALATITLGAIFVLCSTAYAYGVFGNAMKAIGSHLYILNLACIVVPSLALGYLLCVFVKKREVIGGMQNVISLFLAFVSGSFVQQSLLTDGVLTVAKFTPSYYFVRNNDLIFELTKMDSKQLTPIYQNMGIVLLFGVVIFIVAFIIQKQKRKNII
ncbi:MULTISPECIES: ABC transporter permease [unclassified Breznakia]|uniref:ABC transporter permease n=1 Tax=unclassified Breznakia TaxID=2623764 RepID=UPI002476F64E|nr:MULTISPECIES: ABC transporter permease [unclassified Breznakia]MDH6366854.1 ABC-2 type transport system permease protein [Breznakia sp. PH1-1]MDH6404032.1 ABC-2 type transport system permease protein [Breznakia sp. PF1-11]MDH6411746.1 ABC-2 type transport system permease protein [Breznakia sp. PFB1-11]MDH6414020.1 ABC-2 type transport system permease protein [Breznakia sp. PFB1-14]MDH6416450.1 ABC-2 type transport system permease protein [Breznakia sp. PFB1-4]